MTATLAVHAASCSGVRPLAFWFPPDMPAFGSAPRSSRAWTISTFPLPAATCSERLARLVPDVQPGACIQCGVDVRQASRFNRGKELFVDRRQVELSPGRYGT